MEAVNASDLATPWAPIVTLAAAEQAELEALLAAEKLGGVVTPRVPLDLTPMARPEVFLRAAELLLRSDAAVLLVGLVPFTPNIATEPTAATAFARELADRARAAGKPVGLVVDAGSAAEPYRAALAEAGLPVFTRVEEAIAGLQVISNQ
jgi:acyl-CoA synthetase (NDP forming)